MSNFNDYTTDELREWLDEGFEYLGEMEAEIGSEVAMFGDGPPGSALQVASIRESIAAGLAEAARRGLDVRPLPAPCPQISSILRYVAYNPEPFPADTPAGMLALERAAINEAPPEASLPPEDDIPF